MIIKVTVLSAIIALSSAGLLSEITHLPISGISLSASAGLSQRDDKRYPPPSFPYPPLPVNYALPTLTYPTPTAPLPNTLQTHPNSIPIHHDSAVHYYAPTIPYLTSPNTASSPFVGAAAGPLPTLSYSYSDRLSYGAASSVASAPSYYYQPGGSPPVAVIPASAFPAPTLTASGLQGSSLSLPISQTPVLQINEQPSNLPLEPASSSTGSIEPTTSSSSSLGPVPSAPPSSLSASSEPAPSASTLPVVVDPAPSVAAPPVPVFPIPEIQSPVSPIHSAASSQSLPTSAVASPAQVPLAPVRPNLPHASFRLAAPTGISYVSSPALVPAVPIGYGFGW